MPGDRVALFGGTFDPPHVGHLIVAEHASEEFELDRVIWMPCSLPPHKARNHLTSADDRLEMAEIAIRDNPRFEVSRRELDRGGRSYTVFTLRELREQHPDWDLRLLLGADNWHDFESQWYQPEEVLALARPLVYPREGFQIHIAGDVASVVAAPVVSISSTDIRTRVRAGRSIRYMVPEAVRDYIAAHSLYRKR